MATLKDIARILTDKYNMKGKDAEVFVNAFVDTILEGLESDRQVKVKGLGTFKITAVKERASINVNTGEPVTISGHDKISFTPDAALKDLVNKPFAQFDTKVIPDNVAVEDILQDAEDEEDDNVAEEPIMKEPAMEEPAMEEPAIVTPEPVAEETPRESIAEEAVTQEEPIAEEAATQEEPIAEEAATQEEPIAEEETTEEHPVLEGTIEEQPVINEEYDDDDEEENNHSLLHTMLLCIIIGIAAFAGGYYCALNDVFGLNTTLDAPAPATTSPAAVKAPEKKTTKTAIPATNAKKDSIKAEEGKKQEPTSASNAATPTQNTVAPAKNNTATTKNVATTTNKETATTKKEDSKKPVALTQYNSDVRVRTGAYAIIGTKTKVTVRKGETLTQLSRRHLGPGMDCYVEAYNGGKKELKEGETLLIPKLVTKKSLKK